MAEKNMKKVAVIGAGTMGPGMAATFARNGFDAALFDVKTEQLEKAKGAVDFVYTILTGGGFMTAEEADAGRGRIAYTDGPRRSAHGGGLRGRDGAGAEGHQAAGLPGDRGARRRRLILASNTSGIPISDLASVTRVPSRVVGMHWSNPPHLIPVIEVIRGEQTSDEAAQTPPSRLSRQIGMVPGLVDRDIAGFVENRILYAIMREALHLLDEGRRQRRSDRHDHQVGDRLQAGRHRPAGAARHGRSRHLHERRQLSEQGLSTRHPRSASTVTDKVAEGKLGIKTQGGLFDYTPEKIQQLQQQRGRKLVATRKALSES